MYSGDVGRRIYIYIWNVFIYLKEKLLQKRYQWSLCTDWSSKKKNFDCQWHFNTSATCVFRFLSATQMVRQSGKCGRSRKQSASLLLGFLHRNASSNSRIPGGKREGGEDGKQQLVHLSIQSSDVTFIQHIAINILKLITSSSSKQIVKYFCCDHELFLTLVLYLDEQSHFPGKVAGRMGARKCEFFSHKRLGIFKRKETANYYDTQELKLGMPTTEFRKKNLKNLKETGWKKIVTYILLNCWYWVLQLNRSLDLLAEFIYFVA